MQRIKLLLIAICVGFFVFSSLSDRSVSAFVTGSDPGNTGAPGEGTCAGCHFGGAPGGVLAIEGLPDFYSANQEINLTVTLSQAGRSSFGFQATVIDDQGRAEGEIIVTDTPRTQLRSGNFGGHDRTYIEQTQAGVSGSGTTTWTFRWRAPAATTGRISIYVAGVAANNDSSSLGDSVYLLSKSSNPAPTTRAVRVMNTSISAGNSDEVSIEIDALGDENTIGFSLNFDPAKLSFIAAQLGSGLPGGTTLLTATNQSSNGRVGLAVSLPFEMALVPGTRTLFRLTFRVSDQSPLGPSTITFGDSPIAREFNRPNATSIPISSVAFVSGSVNITTPIQPRTVRAVGSTILIGSTGPVLVEVDTLGNENGLAFSLIFDQAKLSFVSATLGSGAAGASLNINSSQLASGRVGIAFALPANQALPPGTQPVVAVNFTPTQSAPPGPTQIAFGDTPVLRELVTTTATSLPANYVAGTVTIEPSYEGDTSPRSFGNGVLSLADWVQGGRFAVALDVPSSPSEFQRADCAPRDTLGNGVLSLSDWVQAGRYGAGLDPITMTGGPSGPVGLTSSDHTIARSNLSPARTARRSGSAVVVVSPVSRRGIANVVMSIEASGVENAINFTLAFDPNRWEFVGAQSGWDAMNATLIVGRTEIASGKVQVVLALPPGVGVSPGWRQLVSLKFRPVDKHFERSPRVGLIDDRSVVNVLAEDRNFHWEVKHKQSSKGELRPRLINGERQ